MLDWLACTLVRLIGGLACLLPPAAAVWLGERLGDVARWVAPKRTRVGLTNLRAAFDGELAPREAHRVIRRCYRQLGAGMIELLRLPVIDRAYIDRYIQIEGMPRFEATVASRRPIILLTGHYGNWELSSIAAALLGYPIMALARVQERLPRLYRLLVSYRESKGCTIVHKGGAMKRLLEALERRQLVGIVGDQATRQGLFVEFFGRPALFATGPFDLAYTKRALLVPAFIHRLRGPFHRLVVEPAIDLERFGGTDEAIRAGIEQFAAVLARHIREDPGQWLWMHKRWKHTPARQALVLSDGKLGHVKQSLVVVEALRARHPALTHEVIEVRFRHPLARAAALLWSGWVPRGLGASRCLSWALTRESARELLGRYADLIVSCGASTAPVNLLWSAENLAQSICLMNPAPIPLSRFDLVIAPRHDRLAPRANLIQTDGAIVRPLSEDALEAARHRLVAHPNFRSDGPPAPSVALFIGGSTPDYELSPAFAEALMREIQLACQAVRGSYLVTTSRRTGAAVERCLERFRQDDRCRLLLLAGRDRLDLPAPAAGGQAGGTFEGMLGASDLAIVTGESISMVSEACASGRHVIVVEPPRRDGRSGSTKHGRFLRHLEDGGYIRVVAASELGRTIQAVLLEDRPLKRLDTFEKICHAVGRLL